MGVYEIESFAQGTLDIAQAVAKSGACSVVGGGDSVAAIQSAHLGNKITHLSTGGGATLEFIEFGTLPGVDALSERAVLKR